MKAVQFTEYGGPEVLEVVDVNQIHPRENQIRISVHAAGVNGIDWKTRAGYMKDQMPLKFPAGTGREAAGEVNEIGEDVTGVVLGDEVFGLGANTLADYAVLTSWAKKPAGLSFEEAAGYPVAVETAMRILNQVGVQPGQTLLVSGASGGVGSAVVQIAKQRGISIIATASERNQGYLRSLGAISTVYGAGLVDRVRALAPGGVHAALDIAGSGVIPELIELTGEPSKVLSIADFSAPQMGAQVSSVAAADASKAFAEVAQWFTEGKFSMPVARTFTLQQVGEAQELSKVGHTTGKLVVKVHSHERE